MSQWPEVGWRSTLESATITSKDKRGAGDIGNEIETDSREESADGF